MPALPSLPQTATEYARASRREQEAALVAIRRQWRRMGGRFDASWSFVGPAVVAILAEAQRRSAALADEYIPAVLEETGQTRLVAADAELNVAAFAGVTGSGMTVADTLSLAPVRAKQAVEAGGTTAQALLSAGKWLTATSGTILSDTGRAAEVTGMATRNVRGYVRMLTPPSCARCVILAGRRYRTNAGFQRHPGCDCRHIPASESMAGDMTVDLDSYLGSLDKEGQVKLLGSKANWQAWDEFGADPRQIVNAYRRGGLRTAQGTYGGGGLVKYTTEGTSRRGWGARQMAGATRLDLDAGATLVNGKRVLVRRMPETILATTQGHEQVLRQLRLYGWVS